MFCPKCHTELLEDDKFCKRCGTEIQSQKKTSYGSFSSSKTFSRMSNKNIINNTHENQYEYSLNYSDVLNDNNESHETQYEYNKKYSSIKKDNNDPHETQYEYNKKYSSIKKDNNAPHETQYEYNKDYSNITKDNNDPHEDQYKYSENYSNTNTDYVTSDENYKDSYIGTNIKAIKQDKYSIGALLFGPFYLLYRKIYPQAIVLLVIYIILSAYTQNSYDLIIKFFVNLVLCFKFKSIYLNHVEKKIANIKNANPDKSSNEIMDICKRNGGVLDLKTVVIIFFIYLVIACAYQYSMTLDIEREPNDESETIYEPEPTTENQVTNNNQVSSTTIENLSFNLPMNTTQYSDYDDYKSFLTDDFCSISVSTTNARWYKSETEYLNVISSSEKKSSITPLEYNNYTWYNLQIMDEDYIDDENVILYNKKLYKISFITDEFTDCESAKKYVMNSTKFQ